MAEPVKKRVDESWKEQAEQEKHSTVTPSPAPTPVQRDTPQEVSGGEELPQARFDFFISGMVMEALIALGDMAHPTTRRQAAHLPQAKYLIDLLGVLEEKTKSNLTVEEEKLLTDALYQLRIRYLAKAGGPTA